LLVRLGSIEDAILHKSTQGVAGIAGLVAPPRATIASACGSPPDFASDRAKGRETQPLLARQNSAEDAIAPAALYRSFPSAMLKFTTISPHASGIEE